MQGSLVYKINNDSNSDSSLLFNNDPFAIVLPQINYKILYAPIAFAISPNLIFEIFDSYNQNNKTALSNLYSEKLLSVPNNKFTNLDNVFIISRPGA